MRKEFKRLFLLLGLLILVLIGFAYARTLGKTDIEFRIHINEQLVHESAFGESPTFAIWLEDNTGKSRTVFATRRAAEGDWEGKAEVPVALPMWFEVAQNELGEALHSGSEGINNLDGSTGATPEPGYFLLRVNATPGIKITAWIEVNLAGDFNDFYKEYDEVLKKEDEYRSGQPALLYKAELEVLYDFKNVPELSGMTLLDQNNRALVKPIQGITTATDIFDEMSIKVVKPKPRIIKN